MLLSNDPIPVLGGHATHYTPFANIPTAHEEWYRRWNNASRHQENAATEDQLGHAGNGRLTIQLPYDKQKYSYCPGGPFWNLHGAFSWNEIKKECAIQDHVHDTTEQLNISRWLGIPPNKCNGYAEMSPQNKHQLWIKYYLGVEARPEASHFLSILNPVWLVQKECVFVGVEDQRLGTAVAVSNVGSVQLRLDKDPVDTHTALPGEALVWYLPGWIPWRRKDAFVCDASPDDVFRWECDRIMKENNDTMPQTVRVQTRSSARRQVDHLLQLARKEADDAELQKTPLAALLESRVRRLLYDDIDSRFLGTLTSPRPTTGACMVNVEL